MMFALDLIVLSAENLRMDSMEMTTASAMNELNEALARLVAGPRDAEVMRQACERMDAMREELRQRIGTVEVAVDLVRDARNR